MSSFEQYQDKDKYELVKEGLVTCVNEKGHKKKAAFYNPAQVINRDLSIACVQWYIDGKKSEYGKKPEEPLTYLEALSASGLRSLRVAKETQGLSTITANDLEEVAVEQIRRNIELNQVAEDGAQVQAVCSDATALMYAHRGEAERFDIIDIDPYGAPSIFLDPAVQAVKDGGLLQVTATDLQNLCGGPADVCFRKYGSIPLKSRFSHEMAIRIVLANIALRAQAYNRYIEPVVSLMIDFYVRVFVRVGSGGQTQQNTTLLGHVWQCPSCHYFETQPLASKHKDGHKFIVSSGTPVPPECPFCQAHFKMAGPLWLGPLHQMDAVDEITSVVESKDDAQFASKKKLLGLLSVARSELPDVPLFYHLSDLCNVLRSNCPSMHVFRSAIINAGYRVSGFHTEPYAFKTDAPMHVIWDILRCWKAKSGVGKKQKETTPAYKIMAVEPELQADFTLVEGAQLDKKRARYIKVDGWGPQVKAVEGTSKRFKAKEEEEK